MRFCPPAAVILLLPFALPAAAQECQSWIFLRGTYTHDPATGARVAQYMRTPAVEPLDDPRLVTSRYRRSRTTLRGPDGSVDSTYEVQSWGNGRGGIDAEWERFHDAWRQSILTGGYYNVNTPTPYGHVYGYPGDGYNPTYGPALPGGAYGNPPFASPIPPQGYPQFHAPSYGYPPPHAPRPFGHEWRGRSPHLGNGAEH